MDVVVASVDTEIDAGVSFVCFVFLFSPVPTEKRSDRPTSKKTKQKWTPSTRNGAR